MKDQKAFCLALLNGEHQDGTVMEQVAALQPNQNEPPAEQPPVEITANIEYDNQLNPYRMSKKLIRSLAEMHDEGHVLHFGETIASGQLQLNDCDTMAATRILTADRMSFFKIPEFSDVWFEDMDIPMGHPEGYEAQPASNGCITLEIEPDGLKHEIFVEPGETMTLAAVLDRTRLSTADYEIYINGALADWPDHVVGRGDYIMAEKIAKTTIVINPKSGEIKTEISAASYIYREQARRILQAMMGSVEPEKEENKHHDDPFWLLR